MEEHNQFLKDKPLLVIEEGAVENRNHRSVSISHYKQLKKLVICDRNYCGGCEYYIQRNNQLQTVVVKNRCFYEGYCSSSAEGLLRISNCRSLKVISIGDSFCNYPKFQLSGMRSSHLWRRLWCAGRTDDWSRRNRRPPICDRIHTEGQVYQTVIHPSDLPSLKRVTIKRSSFENTRTVVFSSCFSVKRVMSRFAFFEIHWFGS